MYIFIVTISLDGFQNTEDGNARSGVKLKASRTCVFLALHLTFHQGHAASPIDVR
jgi:hypothetical protein